MLVRAHVVCILRLKLLVLSIDIIFETIWKAQFIIFPELRDLFCVSLVSEGNAEIVLIDFAWGIEADDVVEPSCNDDRNDAEQFKEGPELPFSSNFREFLALFAFSLNCMEDDDHRNDCQVDL